MADLRPAEQKRLAEFLTQMQDERVQVESGPKKQGIGQTALEGYGNGATLGYLPQLQAATAPAMNWVLDKLTGNHVSEEDDSTYLQRRDENILRQTKQAQDNPITAGGSKIVGGLTSAFIPMGAIVEGATIGKAALQGAKAGAVMGALSNPGDVEGEFSGPQLGDRLKNAAIGATIGAPLSALGQGVSKAVGRKAIEKVSDDLEVAARDGIEKVSDDLVVPAGDGGPANKEEAKNVYDFARFMKERGEKPSVAGEADVIGDGEKSLREVKREVENKNYEARKLENLRIQGDQEPTRLDFEEFKTYMHEVKGKNYTDAELKELYRTEMEAAAEEGRLHYNKYWAKAQSGADIEAAQARGAAQRRKLLKEAMTEMKPLAEKIKQGRIGEDDFTRYSELYKTADDLRRKGVKADLWKYPSPQTTDLKISKAKGSGEIVSLKDIMREQKPKLDMEPKGGARNVIRVEGGDLKDIRDAQKDFTASLQGEAKKRAEEIYDQVRDLREQAAYGLSSQQQQLLKQYAEEIKSLYGKGPDEFYTGGADDYIADALERAKSPTKQFIEARDGVKIIKQTDGVHYSGDVVVTDPTPENIAEAVERAKHNGGGARVLIEEEPKAETIDITDKLLAQKKKAQAQTTPQQKPAEVTKFMGRQEKALEALTEEDRNWLRSWNNLTPEDDEDTFVHGILEAIDNEDWATVAQEIYDAGPLHDLRNNPKFKRILDLVEDKD